MIKKLLFSESERGGEGRHHQFQGYPSEDERGRQERQYLDYQNGEFMQNGLQSNEIEVKKKKESNCLYGRRYGQSNLLRSPDKIFSTTDLFPIGLSVRIRYIQTLSRYYGHGCC